MQTLEQLRTEIDSAALYESYGYYLKQIHQIPDAAVVSRSRFILGKCIDKVVLDIGCGGPLHSQIQQVAKEAFGIDKIGEDSDHFMRIDVEEDHNFGIIIKNVVLKKMKNDPNVVICGEILEHLSNPGIFLSNLSFLACEIIISVPNAFCNYGDNHIRRSKENVNIDHVAWYSYRTLRTLVERYNYKVLEFYWADERDAKPGFSEGLIFVVKSGGTNG